VKRILFASVAVAALLATACGGAADTKQEASASPTGGGTRLSLVAYSTPEVVYDELIPAFGKTSAGKGTSIRTSFGASGDQSRAVEGGLEADVVSFSIEPDMTRLIDAGIVDAEAPQLVSTSQVVFIVRKGNPKGIRSWDDLLEQDVEVITPNPFTSGAAKWNLLAAYGDSDSGRGLDFVRKLVDEHVKVQPKSGREALQTFLDGQGDVLLSYEYEATTAQKKGQTDVEFVVPADTIKIDILIAPTKEAPPEAREFVDYVRSAEGQKFFARWGYGAPAAKPGTFTIEDLGGWSEVNAQLFDPEQGTLAKVLEQG
jgi:sulfate/thiosulfate transport system substrate-binding protein